jgi:hypothetical protein
MALAMPRTGAVIIHLPANRTTEFLVRVVFSQVCFKCWRFRKLIAVAQVVFLDKRQTLETGYVFGGIGKFNRAMQFGILGRIARHGLTTQMQFAHVPPLFGKQKAPLPFLERWNEESARQSRNSAKI